LSEITAAYKTRATRAARSAAVLRSSASPVTATLGAATAASIAASATHFATPLATNAGLFVAVWVDTTLSAAAANNQNAVGKSIAAFPYVAGTAAAKTWAVSAVGAVATGGAAIEAAGRRGCLAADKHEQYLAGANANNAMDTTAAGT
jgi:hypothetical protein